VTRDNGKSIGEKENESQLAEFYVFDLSVRSMLAKFRKKEMA